MSGVAGSRYEVYRGPEPFVAAPPEFELAPMRRILEELRDGSRDYVGGVLGRVVDWSWSISPGLLHRLEPVYAERLPVARADREREQPGRAPGPNYMEYGRDTHGRIVIAWLSGIDGYAEVWESPELGVVLHAAPRRPGDPVDPVGNQRRAVTGVRRAQWSGDQMVASAEQLPAAHIVHEYRYGPDGVSEIRGETRLNRDSERWEEPERELWLVERDARRRPAVRGAWVVAAEPPTLSDLDVENLERAVIDGLTGLIPDLIARIGVPGVVYFLMLSWTRWFNVQICPATERTRTRLLERRPYKPLDAYLHYNDSGINCNLPDWGMSPVLETGERLELELCRRREPGRGDAIRFEVARRLNELDWTGRMQTSDDFAVGMLSETGPRNARIASFRASLESARFTAVVARENRLADELAARRTGEHPIKPEEALAALREAFSHFGIDPTTPVQPREAGRLAWNAFLAFVAIPIIGFDPQADEDAILVEQSSTPAGGFTLSLARQLSKTNQDGEHSADNVIYVNITFTAQPGQCHITETSRWASRADLDDARAVPADIPALGYVLDHDTQPTTIQIAQTLI